MKNVVIAILVVALVGVSSYAVWTHDRLGQTAAHATACKEAVALTRETLTSFQRRALAWAG